MRATFNKTWLWRVGLAAALLNVGTGHAQDVGVSPISTDVGGGALTQSLQNSTDMHVVSLENPTVHTVEPPVQDHLKMDEPKLSAALAASPLKSSQAYSWKSAEEDLKSIKWEAAGTFAGITAIGVKSWKWGSSSFHFNSEHWFGKQTGSGGADKLGHAFTSYTLTNAFAERLQAKGRTPERAALSAALLTQALMLYVEIFDGVSGDHGFSKEDFVMNALGTGLAYLRQTHPQIKDLIDYRMEYKPSGYKGFRPLSDYEGQKYLIALKLSGVKSLKDTPLKYVELQAGYYTRGFSKEAKKDGQERKRHGFVGIGVNLSQLVFGSPEPQDNGYEKAGRFFFEHIQLPYTAVRKNSDF